MKRQRDVYIDPDDGEGCKVMMEMIAYKGSSKVWNPQWCQTHYDPTRVPRALDMMMIMMMKVRWKNKRGK